MPEHERLPARLDDEGQVAQVQADRAGLLPDALGVLVRAGQAKAQPHTVPVRPVVLPGGHATQTDFELGDGGLSCRRLLRLPTLRTTIFRSHVLNRPFMRALDGAPRKQPSLHVLPRGPLMSNPLPS